MRSRICGVMIPTEWTLIEEERRLTANTSSLALLVWISFITVFAYRAEISPSNIAVEEDYSFGFYRSNCTLNKKNSIVREWTRLSSLDLNLRDRPGKKSQPQAAQQ